MKKAVLIAFLLLLAPAAVGASSGPLDLLPFTRGSWQTLRQAHQGQAIVVHFWGLTCGPCLAELPKWTTEAKARSDMHLVLIDASPFGDNPATASVAISQAGLGGVENWIFADTFEERLRFEIDPHWHGEMPYTVLISRDGTATPIIGVMDFDKLDAWLDAQAKAKS